ncbi:MAG: hypothetical protein AAGA03_14640, partial [Planctomycetota bacterium]
MTIYHNDAILDGTSSAGTAAGDSGVASQLPSDAFLSEAPDAIDAPPSNSDTRSSLDEQQLGESTKCVHAGELRQKSEGSISAP